VETSSHPSIKALEGEELKVGVGMAGVVAVVAMPGGIINLENETKSTLFKPLSSPLYVVT
jgi:hypothetical protein